METSFVLVWAKDEVLRTDPTYKEWKPIGGKVGCGMVLRTDPTYKEWKLIETNSQDKLLLRTDPTYKEWKRFPAKYRTS